MFVLCLLAAACLAAPAAGEARTELPEHVTRLPGGNLRYDDGMIAFEMPENGKIWSFRMKTDERSGSRYPEGTFVASVHVCIPPPPDAPDYYDAVLTETQERIVEVAVFGVAQFPDDADAVAFAWSDFAGTENTGYATLTGRTAKYHQYQNRNPRWTEWTLPLSGNRVFGLLTKEYPDGGRKEALELFLDTLEIRDSLYAEPPVEPIQLNPPVPTHAPDLSGWTGYWMTRDDSLAEMIVTDNGDGTLHARLMSLPAGDSEATLIYENEDSMRFAEQYGSLNGRMTRQADGGLRLDITGGTAMEDEEATEYQGYYARGFTFTPAEYEEMWYQTPEDASGPEDDWLGDWAEMGGGTSRLRIAREDGGMKVWITLGEYRFSGEADLGSDTLMILYGERFSCMLVLNRKLDRIAVMEIGTDIEEVYELAGNPYTGVMMFGKASEHSFSVTPEQTGALTDVHMPPDLTMPVP